MNKIDSWCKEIGLFVTTGLCAIFVALITKFK